MARKIALGVEYCGAAYCGWQRQTSPCSIQAKVEDALSRVADEAIHVHCAGRTDAGVHALQQVVHFETTAQRAMREWVLGANVSLPEDISILWARQAANDFHARFSATARRYQYIILNRPSRAGLWHRKVAWEARRLDESAMREAATVLVGTHDFTAYRAAACQVKSPVRTVTSLLVKRYGERLVIDIEADGFLRYMVRNIAGTLMKVGRHEADQAWVAEVLASKDRTQAGPTATAAGLYLAAITYPSQHAIPLSLIARSYDLIAKDADKLNNNPLIF